MNLNVNVDSPEYLSAIKAYPNPFNSSFTLELNGIPEGELNVVVYDILGKEVYQSEVKVRRSSKLALNIIAGNLAPGTYYCKVSSGTSSQSVKLLKQ